MILKIDPDRLAAAWTTARADLLAECRDDGPQADAAHWVGELSSSALSTATAVSALALVQSHLPQRNPDSGGDAGPTYEQIERLISAGLNWLADHQNPDGGWGDTDLSHSNIATTMLARAAFRMNGVPVDHGDLAERADAYIKGHGGVAGLRRRFGRDKTFAVPILAKCALAGMVDWREVAPLPFELACLPQSWYRFMRLPVVSYAIPALVAVGQARFCFEPPLNPLTRLVRNRARRRSLEVLQQMQPDSGGYLEAVPLTSFVVMCLAGIGRAQHPVVRQGTRFLVDSVRADGSWPIDTNLATWLTTLAVNALASGGEDVRELGCLDWLLSCQHTRRHPFTGAEPGGWAWTDLSGGVPDADDTAGALLALAEFYDAHIDDPSRRRQLLSSAADGVDWLLDMQNSNGGWPTFCRGWGKLPFDRSGTDLSAHAMRALHAWRGHLLAPADKAGQAESGRIVRLDNAIHRGLLYLARRQRPDGSWLPLWFGNQHRPEETNPVYGTARVLLAYADLNRMDSLPARRGAAWLAAAINPDGGWGAPRAEAGAKQPATKRPPFVSSVEETALAVESLLRVPESQADRAVQDALNKGLQWLADAVEANRHTACSPIGFYFAKLWYYERLYPLTFCTAALGSAVRSFRASEVPVSVPPPGRRSAGPPGGESPPPVKPFRPADSPAART